jgi:hypothetical protein
VLRQAAEGRFHPVLTLVVKAIMFRRSSIIPAEHDDKVLALGLPLYLLEAKPDGRLAVFEASRGQFRLRFLKGALRPSEQPAL